MPLSPEDSVELQLTAPPKDPTAFRRAEISGGGDSRDFQSDDAYLERLGKRPRLTRSFGFMSILGFVCSALLTWESILVNSVTALLNGGPAGVIWGFLVNWIGTISVNAVLGELASIAPTAAGQYHWVAMLAPESSRAFLAYITAWMTTTAWQAIAVSGCYLIATILQGIVVLGQPDYTPQAWHTLLIMWAISLFSVLVNSTTGRALARFEGVVLIVHLVGFFCVLIPMVYLGRHNDPATVFTTFLNEGGWPTQGLSFLVGFPSGATSLIGADCAVHLSEEIQSAAIIVPRAIMYTIVINGVLAFAMMIGMMFCLTDLDAALEASTTMYYPFLQVFYSSVNSQAGACIMAGIILVLALASIVGIYASASRMMWSFSRDKGLPLSGQLVKLTKNSLPVFAVGATLVITVLLSFIVLGSSVALSALLSLVFAALYSSYLLTCGLLLWRRCHGDIAPYTDNDLALHSGQLQWGPWRVPKLLGIANNIFACLYIVLVLFWSFWPQYTPTTPETANWSVVVYSAVVIFSLLWYFLRARHYFKGPIKEV